MTAPRVSVVAAVFNGERDIEAACASVLRQAYSNLDLIVVDDASVDATPRILERLSRHDNRVRVLRNDDQIGQTRSLNRGLWLSQADFVARIDADDLFLPTKIERQVAFLADHPEITVVGSWAGRMSASGDAIGIYRAPIDQADIDFGLIHSSPLCHVSVMMRRAAAVSVGGYDERYQYAADLKLWSDLRRAGHRLANMPEVLVNYRVAESTFGGSARVGRAADESADIIRENAKSIWGLNVDVTVCRAIHLRSQEGSGLSDDDRCAAFVMLGELARRQYGSVPWRLHCRLLAGAAWSFAIGTRPRDVGGRSSSDSTGRSRLVGLGTASWLGRAISRLGARRLASLGGFVRRATSV